MLIRNPAPALTHGGPSAELEDSAGDMRVISRTTLSKAIFSSLKKGLLVWLKMRDALSIFQGKKNT